MHRRTLMKTAAAAIMVPMTAPADSTEIRGDIVFEDRRAIPKGQIHIYLKAPEAQGDGARLAVETLIKSDGGSKIIPFLIEPQAPWDPAPSTMQVIVHLERADGWLLARGSAKLEPGAPVSVTLNRVMYLSSKAFTD